MDAMGEGGEGRGAREHEENILEPIKFLKVVRG